MNIWCLVWCDCIFMFLFVKELVLRLESEEKVVIYDYIGFNVCMGDYKFVFLVF